MDNDRLKQHIEHTLSYTLGEHQYGIVTEEKINSIVTNMVEYLQGLYDVHLIIDFRLSVIKVSDDIISVSIAIMQLIGVEPYVIKSELRTRFDHTDSDNFERAMKGI